MMKYFNIIILAVLFVSPDLFSQNGLHITGGHLNQTGGSIVLKNTKLVNGGDFTSQQGEVLINGTATATDATLGGINVTDFDTLKINKTTNDVQLEQTIQVNGRLLFANGRLLLNGSDVNLGSNGLLLGESETAHATGLTGGELIKVQTLDMPISIPPGNLGAVITSSNDLGETTVKRGHLPYTSCSGTGINRYFKIATKNPGSGTLRFHYLDAELNGIPEAELQLWRLDNNQWTAISPLGKSVVQNYVETADVDLNGIFTLGSATTMPLQTDFCKDITVELDITSQAMITASMVFDNTTYPDCIPHSQSLDVFSFNCDNRGINEVILTVVDNEDIIHTCTAIVTIEDNTHPCCPESNVIYVDANTPDDNDGSDWDNAFATLSRALEVADRCAIATEIWVAGGTYYPTTGTDRAASFSLVNGIAIYGGFVGGETSLSQRDITNNETVLSGDIGIPNDSTDNSYHIIKANSNINGTAVLDGFTITKGLANGIPGDQSGAGILNEGGSPTVLHCQFVGNTALDNGGGIANEGGQMTLSNCLFTTNRAQDGAGIANTANATPAITNTVFDKNTANANGGGIYNNASSPTIDSCLFNENTAGSGGGIVCTANSSSMISGCTFTDNSANSNGGGVYSNTSSPTIANCSFKENNANFGGGIYHTLSPSPSIVNCLLANNAADKGGAVYNRTSSTVLTNCTITGNTATDGGGLFNHTDAFPTLTNCILWDNGIEVANFQSQTTITYSIVEGGHSGIGNLDIDPQFTGIMDFTLSPCSPAIDAGDNAANSTVTDLAGNPRTVGSTSNLPVIDMGAYELPGCPTATPNTWTGNGDGFLWTDPANWSDGVVPCQCHDVLIPTGNDVTIPTGAEGQGRTLEVELGAQLLTDPAATMEIGN